MLSNKELNPIVTELFIRERELNTSIVLITHSYFAAPRNIMLNSTYYFIMKIPNKEELKQIAFDHWSDIEFKKCIAKSCSFLLNDCTAESDNLLRFRKNHSERI